MTFLFWAAAIVVFAIAEAATTALVSIWFAVGAAAAMVASIFTASLGVQCAVFAVVSAVTLTVMLPLLAKRRTMRQPPITNGSPLTIGSRGIVLREIPQGDIGRVRVDGLDWQARTVDGTPLPKDARCEVKNVDGAGRVSCWRIWHFLAQLRHWWGWLYRSWCKAWAALPRLCPATWKTRRRCWSWCRQTMGWIPPA